MSSQKHLGQALAEGLVVMLVLLLLFAAIPWLGRLLDMALQSSNASSYGAFQLSRAIPDINKAELDSRFFIGPDKNWRDRKGKLLLQNKSIHVQVDRAQKLDDSMQPGMNASYARSLRQDWKLEDEGIANVSLQVTPTYSVAREKPDGKNTNIALGLGLGFYDHSVFTIKRHTAILTGAGHAVSDRAAHQHTALSEQGWQKSARLSYETGQKIQSYAQSVDAPWGRTQPVFDWLQPWQGLLPAHHLEK
ncbi:MAG: pilus assembly protein [Alcaligenaceae bacterium]|nr:pilus assembly protein [Alcaligenaceae bacterium]